MVLGGVQAGREEGLGDLQVEDNAGAGTRSEGSYVVPAETSIVRGGASGALVRFHSKFKYDSLFHGGRVWDVGQGSYGGTARGREQGR